jgi:methionine-gamma-lyase
VARYRIGPALAIGSRRLQGEPEAAPETTRWTSLSPAATELGLSTRAIHHGYDPAEEHGALTPPIFMTSTYAFETAEAGSELFRGERAGNIYRRTRNPTEALLESRLASLEGGEAGLAVASGMGSISATMWTLLNAGDSVVIDRILYGNTFAFFTKGLTRFGVNVRLADFTNPNAVAQALAADMAICLAARSSDRAR